MEIVSMGHTNFLVKVELTWVQNPGSSFMFLSRLPMNTLNNSYRTKIAQIKIITHIDFLEKKMTWPTLIFY
jgi:hypothetical protein